MDQQEINNTIKVEYSDEYKSFIDWIQNLTDDDYYIWLMLLSIEEHTYKQFDHIAKRSVLLYCIEMGISEIPASEEYVNNIVTDFIRLFFLYHSSKIGNIELESELKFGQEIKYKELK